MNQTAPAYTHAHAGAPISDHQDVYPVIVYVHGWGGYRNLGQNQTAKVSARPRRLVRLL